MPLTGTLRDLSLPNLVQVQCSEQNHAQVHFTRGAHQGTLVFAAGELTYASADDQAGESAVYELLTWEDGDFRVDDEVRAVERNVTMPWSALLIEGLRRADEVRAERDSTLEANLRSLKGTQGVRAAVVVRSDGAVRADARGETVTEERAVILKAVANVERISALLGLGAPRQITLLNPTEKIWLQKLDDGYLACWLDGRASVDAVKATLQSIFI